MAIGSRDLSPKILAKLIKVSMKLLMHSPRVEQIVSDRLAYKFAVTEENKFLNGTGSGQPLGLFYASASGINTDRDVSTDNTATAVTVDGLKNAFYAVPAQYRKRPSFGFIGHRDLFKMVSKLKDGEGQYLWQPSNQVGQPDRLLSAQVFESEYAPNTFTASLYVGLFGDLSFYGICDSMDMSIQRLNELYARNNQIGFIGRKYTDGMPTLSTAFARVKLAAG
jgi:HK97 family phage major capsid protein